MRKVLLIILSIILLCSCSEIKKTADAETISYELCERKYDSIDNQIQSDVHIAYPQLTNASEILDVDKINDSIEAMAKSYLNIFDDISNSEIDVKYNITLQSEDILSILFTSSTFFKGQSYPLLRCKTIVIDLNSGESLKLTDYLNVNQSLVDNFSELFLNVTEYSDEWSEQSRIAVNEYVQEMTIVDLLKTSDAPENPDYCSFLTDDSIVLCVAVPYQMGSYAFFEAKTCRSCNGLV